jgi:TusA-related sulfurtransferase
VTFALAALVKPIDRVVLALARRWLRLEPATVKTVTLRRVGAVTVTVARDFTGDTCLRANLLTKKALDHCAPGDVLEIATDNLASVETIPFMLPGHGCTHIATIRTESGWKIYARKEDNPKCGS